MGKKKSKTMLAIILVGILGVISIAYAAISTTLFITSGGSATVDPNESGAVPNSGATASAGVRFLDAADSDALAPGTNTGIAVSKDKTNSHDTATAGTVEITNTSKTNDTVLIKDTDLGAFGSYVIYKLEVKNEGANPVKLTKVPYITNGTGYINGNSVGGGTTGVAHINADDDNLKNKISVRIYTEVTTDEKGKKDCEEKYALKEWTNETNNDNANYLLAKTDDNENAGKNKTTWYVKVSYKDDASDKFTPGTFGFALNPVWDVV